MEKLQTKFDEHVFTTSVLEEMKDQYTASRLFKQWNEDFIDEYTGEAVPVVRREILLDRGVLIDSTVLQSIQFYLSSGDIEYVEVSNQQRSALFSLGTTAIWCITAQIGKKKKNFYLYANSAVTAIEIGTDFIEQSYKGTFKFSTIKELDLATLVSNISQEEDFEGDLKFYKTEIEIEKEENFFDREFIVKALDAENAKAIIEAYLTNKFQEENDTEEFKIKLVAAKVIPCEAIIDSSFCMKYIKRDGEAH